MYKIETYIPKESLQELRQALLEVDAGHIGKYRGCLSYYPVMGVWFSEEGAQNGFWVYQENERAKCVMLWLYKKYMWIKTMAIAPSMRRRTIRKQERMLFR